MTLSTALRLGRVSNLPTVWTNVVAGVALGGAAFSPTVLGCLLVAATAFYVGGMYLNDAFDADVDAVERPERPIPAGQVGVRVVHAAGFALLASAILIAVAASVLAGAPAARTATAAITLAATIVLYDVAHKGVIVAPIIMGACRALLYLVCALASGGWADHALLAGGAALLLYVAGLTYLAAQENLREPANTWPVLMVSAPALMTFAGGHGGGAALIAIVVFAVWTAYAVHFAARDEQRDVAGAVTRLIAGISLCDAIAVATVAGAAPAVVVALGAAMTRLFQRFVPGT
jgi:4-hydroxybenzoate polyprenyltransferase